MKREIRNNLPFLFLTAAFCCYSALSRVTLICLALVNPNKQNQTDLLSQQPLETLIILSAFFNMPLINS
jgi:hypothetical protein